MNWKEIDQFSRYNISECGRVWDKENQRDVAQMLTGVPAYYYVNMYRDDGKRKLVRVHRLVAAAYCEGRSEVYSLVDHIDRNPHNNHYTNLRWVDHKGNSENRESTLWYDETTTLLDYCRVNYENPLAAVAYIRKRLEARGSLTEAFAEYHIHLVYKHRTEKVRWKGQEVYILDLVGGDIERYSQVIDDIKQGVDEWAAVIGIPKYPSSVEIRENGVWYWYPDENSWSSENGKSVQVLRDWMRDGLSTEEIVDKGKPEIRSALGVVGTLDEICKHFGVTKELVTSRRAKHGISLDEALSYQRQRVKVLEINGETKSPSDWSKQFGLNPKRVIKYRSIKKCTFKEAFEHFGVDCSSMCIEE